MLGTELQQSARIHLEKGRYRDAVVCYKALLKSEQRPEWLAGLASAYAGRARALAATGLMQEAIDVWRSRAQLCGTALWDGPYVSWLIGVGRLGEVIDHLAARCVAPAGNSDVEIAALEAQLAPAVLNAGDAALGKLPAESMLVRHRALALAALAAYADKDAAALESALTGISFRSPYRDLRSVLKVMVLWETDRDAACQAISRIPAKGPFESLVAPVRVVLLNGFARLQNWGRLNLSQQALALDMMGCPPTFAPLLRALAAAQIDLAPMPLFDLVQKNSSDLPDLVTTGLWQWLAPWAKRRGCDNPRIFGKPTAAEKECATALAVEITGEWDHAESHWLRAEPLLECAARRHDRLRAALVLRHVALAQEHLSADQVLDQQGHQMLTKSLELDVQDASAHLRVIRHWRQQGDLKRAREQLALALQHFPDDVALLAEAVETALAAGAFKKAIATAQRLLLLDPMNRKVRTLVGNAHLSHAVKQIANNKPEAAKSEIQEAANWLDGSTDQGRMYLLQAWAEPAASPERLRLARLAVTTWGAGLAAGWRVLREAQAVFIHADPAASTRLLNEAGIDVAQALGPNDLHDLLQALELEGPLIRNGSDPLAPWRKAMAALASSAELDEQTCRRICEAFSRHQEHDLQQTFANAARKRWPDQPIFVYHAVAARFLPRHGIRDERDRDDLESAHERASQVKDIRLALRIEALLDKDAELDPSYALDEPELPQVPDRPSPHFDPSKLSPAALRAMFQEAIDFGGAKAFLKTARHDLGEALYKQVERDCAGDKPALLRRLVELVVELIASNPKPTPSKLAKPLLRPKDKHPTAPESGQGNLFNE